jgi:chromatin remodeling complex protein RSC6
MFLHSSRKTLWYAIYYGSQLAVILITLIMAMNSALSKPLTLSPELEAVIGKGPMPRTEVVKQLWVYIKKHDLQNPANKRNILADEKLKPVFGGKAEVTMFEMTKLVSAHLK